MKTTIYLIRLDAAETPVERALVGLRRRQIALTRDFLAVRSVDQCYCSPEPPVVQTAALLAAPHGLRPRVIEELVDRAGAETPTHLQSRVMKLLEELFAGGARGENLLLVAQNPIARTYLAGLLGMTPERAERIHLDHCGISVLVHEKAGTTIRTLNASFHLQGLAGGRLPRLMREDDC